MQTRHESRFSLYRALSSPLWRYTAVFLLLLLSIATGFLIYASAHAQHTTQPISRRVVHQRSGANLPMPDHVVVIVEENHSYSQIIGNEDAPYINALAARGASLTNMHGITHPSQPNYLALFAGTTFNLSSDNCPQSFQSANLGQELLQAGYSFSGYSEDMPHTGFSDCYAPWWFFQMYARKHNPWSNFSNVPTSSNQPFSSFPSDYNSLPTISFVIPNQNNDMHSASVEQADNWLKQHLDSYVQWAQKHNSLLIVTWDEDNDTSVNQIPTLFVGPMVKAGHYGENLNHYNTLRTLEDMYGLPYANNSAHAQPITDTWR
jgi:hypothetical protein